MRELRAKEPIVDLRVLGNRNFALGAAMIFLVGVVLYGTIALLPLFLQRLMGYPALQAGLATSPRGLGSFVAMFVNLMRNLGGGVGIAWVTTRKGAVAAH